MRYGFDQMASTGGLKMRSAKANDIIFKSEISTRLPQYDQASNTRVTSREKQNLINITPLKQKESKTKSEHTLLSPQEL